MSRPALTPISTNINRRKELSSEQRGLIVFGAECGLSYTELAQRFSVNNSTISRTISQSRDRVNNASKPRSGQPKKLNSRDRRVITRYLHQNPQATIAKIIIDLQLAISRRTLTREIKTLDIKHWIAKNRCKLTPAWAETRLTWATKYQGYSLEWWRNIIWTDECSIDQHSGKSRAWSWVPHACNRLEPRFVNPVDKKGHSIMVWAAIWAKQRSELIFLQRDFEAKKHGYSATSYINILEEAIPQIYREGMSFMQDNAPIHNAVKTRAWLADNGVYVLEWPPYSPDLNPIEHAWRILKRKAHELHPEMDSLPGNENSVREAMTPMLQEAWASIEPNMLYRLIESIPDRIQAVIDANGWYTKY